MANLDVHGNLFGPRPPTQDFKIAGAQCIALNFQAMTSHQNPDEFNCITPDLIPRVLDISTGVLPSKVFEYFPVQFRKNVVRNSNTPVNFFHDTKLLPLLTCAKILYNYILEISEIQDERTD